MEQVEVLKRSKSSRCNSQRRRGLLEKVLRREPEKIPKIQASEESLMRLSSKKGRISTHQRLGCISLLSMEKLAKIE